MASCYICGKNPGKFALSVLAGKICPDCQKNIANIRSGKVMEARTYFDNLSITHSDAKEFLSQQYEHFAYEAEAYEEEIRKIKQQEELKNAAKNILLSTTPTLEGYRVVKYIDVIYSEVVYKLSLGKAFGTMLSNTIDSLSIFTTKELSGTTRLIQEAKDYVRNDLQIKAASLGANAIVGLDIESSVSNDGIAKASINGTAVIIEKIEY